jgi:hypothetical protein
VCETGGHEIHPHQTGQSIRNRGHTISRGIYRKTRPWLYTHKIDATEIDITFDTGSKDVYPLYVGSSASIFDVHAHPWEMTRSTNAAFINNHWLVSHRWNSAGVFFDLQRMNSDVADWTLVKPEIFVPGDGTEIPVNEISTNVKSVSFDAANRKAKVVFTKCNSLLYKESLR